MDLRDYIRVLRRGWLPIVGVTLLCTAIGVLLTVLSAKVYTASVQIFVATSNSGTATDLSQGNSFAQDRVQSYTSIATSPSVTDPVVRELGLNVSGDQLAARISADAPANKVLINLHVEDGNAQQAARIANAVASQFSSVVQTTEQTDASGKAVVKLTVIQPAVAPGAPTSPDPVLNIGLGVLIGLVLGVGAVILRKVLDNTVTGAEDLEPFGVPLLGRVPMDKRAGRHVIAFRGDAQGARAEAYRQMRTNMQFVDIDNPPKVIAFTSPMPGDGKTTTAINFAASLAEAGYRVCLVESDLRRPSIARVLDLVGEVGFTTVLVGQAPVASVLQNAGRNFAVLTAGPVPPNPSELLISNHARSIIAEIAAAVDFVIIDTAPLLPVSDGAEIATIADATVVVMRAGKTTRDQAQRAFEDMSRVGERPVGVVLNMVGKQRGDNAYGYYYYAHTPRASASPGKAVPADEVGGTADHETDDSAIETRDPVDDATSRTLR